MNDYIGMAEAHASSLQERKEKGAHDTLLLNAFGGPGAGKSTASLSIAGELKKLGYLAEYVPEYSKELVWEENWELLDGSAQHQLAILEEQMRRVDRLEGKVDFIITDAPILLNQIYNNELTPQYKKMLEILHGQYETYNFVVQRNPSEFEMEGRIHNLEQSRQKDQEILDMLDECGIAYDIYGHASVHKVISDAIKAHTKASRWHPDRRDIPVYLEIPHMADRKAFRELSVRLKEQGAKYDPHLKRWYIPKHTDRKAFARFLPEGEKAKGMGAKDRQQDRQR